MPYKDELERKEFHKRYYREHREEMIQRANERKRAMRKNDPRKNILQSSKGRAKKMGLEFNLEYEDIIIPETCPVFGIMLATDIGPIRLNTPSLDRVDNTKGYIKGNVRIISQRANSLKRDATLEELKQLVLYVEGKI